MMKKNLLFLLALFGAVMNAVAEVDSSISLQTYYAAANGKSGNELRLALFDVIKGHTQIGYSNLGTVMQYSDTENADGQNVVDIYTNCTFTCRGPITWISSGGVGAGLNREHTVPQSWFNEKEPMKSDAFHVYPTDTKANNNRNNFLYGEFAGAGESYSSNKCAETGKKGESQWKANVTSYTYNNQTYVATTSYTGTVYEPDDEYKGDLARGYFYMATRYADVCAGWSGGAFGSARNGLGAYTAELLMKWHRLDPVSEKELIRNEVIYGNPSYNKSSKKQGNRNPFIDYPELAEYIWGTMQSAPVTITALDSPYANESPRIDPAGIEETGTTSAPRKIYMNGQLLIRMNNQVFNPQGQRIR